MTRAGFGLTRVIHDNTNRSCPISFATPREVIALSGGNESSHTDEQDLTDEEAMQVGPPSTTKDGNNEIQAA